MVVQGRKFKKMYGSGGDMTAISNNANTKMTLGQYTDAGIAGAGLVNSAVDAIAPENSYGVQSAAAMGIKRGVSYAATGAKLGSTFGPWGAAIGAGVGLVGGVASGLIGHASAERTQMAMERQQDSRAWNSQITMGNSRVQSDPTMIYGNQYAQAFADGGSLPTGPVKGRSKLPSTPAYYIDGLPTTLDVGAPLANKTWSKTNPFLVDKGDGRMVQWGSDLPTPPLPVVPLPPAPIPLSDKARGLDNTYNTSRDQPRGPAIPTQHRSAGYYSKGGRMKMYADGGQIQPMNSQAVEVDGPSHAHGGVQIPGAEVEGGETISNGFVFSDQLGFADLHKPIAKAIGKVEAKPMNAVRNRTLQLLKGKEQGLALSQELYKRHMGLPSDLD